MTNNIEDIELEIDPRLREKVMSDCEIRNLTRDIIRLRKEEQTEDGNAAKATKERIKMLEDLRMSAGMQIIKLWNMKK